MFRTITIFKEPGSPGQEGATPKAPPKTRAFSVTALGHVEANDLWSVGARGVQPVWITYVGSDEQVRAFTANFRGGVPAKHHEREDEGDAFVMPTKQSPHRWVNQRLEGERRGTIVTAYIPRLFHLEPGAHEDSVIRFILMPPRGWVDRQAEALGDAFGESAREAALGALFAAFLDRRTALPILQDLRFHLQVYRAAQRAAWCTSVTSSHRVIRASGMEAIGLEWPVACNVLHEDLQKFLGEETTRFFREQKGAFDGTARFDPGRRLLPYPTGAAAQLRLALAA